MNRIKRGDNVRVISGKHKNSEGIVLQVFPKEGRAIVEGVNIVSKSQRKDHSHEESGIIKKEAPMYLSKLALVDPKTKGKVTKVNYVTSADGKKVRITKVSKTEMKAK